MNTSLWLTDAEIDEICQGVVRNDAKVRHLRRMGLTVNTKPNGNPLVIRSHAEAILSGLDQRASATPKAPTTDRAALVTAFSRRAA